MSSEKKYHTHPSILELVSFNRSSSSSDFSDLSPAATRFPMFFFFFRAKCITGTRFIFISSSLLIFVLWLLWIIHIMLSCFFFFSFSMKKWGDLFGYAILTKSGLGWVWYSNEFFSFFFHLNTITHWNFATKIHTTCIKNSLVFKNVWGGLVDYLKVKTVPRERKKGKIFVFSTVCSSQCNTCYGWNN